MNDSFLSKISLIDLIRLTGIRRYRDSAESRHRMVMALFPDHLGERPREAAGVLFRGERNAHESFVLLRSRIAPAALPQVQTLRENFSSLAVDQQVAFRITITPVKRNSAKEYTLQDQEAIEAWVKQKLSTTFEEIQIISLKDESIPRTSKTSEKNFLKLVQVDGVARICDLPLLLTMLTNGIGRGKSYGSGLLTVRPL